MSTLTPLQNYVVNVVANDYENYDLVSKEVLDWATKERADANPDTIREALAAVVQDGFVDCYRYSQANGSYERAEFSASKLSELWFYVSSKGKAHLRK
jgi:hypothetical protein